MSAGEIFGKYGGGILEQAIGYGVGGALTPVIEWATRPLAYDINASDPNLILDPATLVVIEQRLQGLGFSGADEATKSGINNARYAHLLAAQFVPPGAGEVLELYRRKVLSPDQATTALLRSGMSKEWIDEFLSLAKVLLSPTDLAMARQQGFIEQPEATTRSALQGVDEADAEILFRMSGLPPGPEQMIELWRRGEVSPERVRQSLIEGHIKLDYADDVMKLRYQPLSASVAAEALVRQRISPEVAIAIAEKNGLQKDDFLLWSDMLGRPIATGQALQLARRGQFTFEQFKEAVARSDVRTEYADDLWKLRRTLPNLFTLRALIGTSAITDELAISTAKALGYDDDIATGIVTAAHHVKHKGTRDLAAGQIDSLYESGLETRQWAIDALIALGYDEHEAEWHVELLEARRLLSALQSDLALIHRSYVNHKIDEAQASTELDQLQMRTEARDLLMQTWTNERAANVQRLTNAQIGMALKHAGMSRDEAVTRWTENGYPSDDANWLADIALKVPHNATSPTPT